MALALTVTLSMGIPSNALRPTGESRFPLAGLWELLTTRPAWSLDDPVTPKQRSGSEARVIAATADATRADGGSGKPFTDTPGAAGEYKPRDNTPDAYTTGTKGRFDAATSVRIASEAKSTSDVYRNADGSYTRRISAGPVNFEDENGVWQPIDTRLVRDASGRWKMAANSLRLSLAGFGSGSRQAAAADASLASTAELATLTFPTGEVFGYTLEGATLAEPRISGSTATYRNVLPSTDVSIYAFDSGVRKR